MENIVNALRKWNPWWAKASIVNLTGRERESKATLIKTLAIKHIKDIVGVRRAGKTTLMYQIIDDLLTKNIEPTKIVFVKFDDVSISTADFEQIENALYSVNHEPEYLFLDEVQEKTAWEKWVKNLYDLNKFKQIFVTGSNASLLSRDLGKLLTGRHISFKLMPFSFREYLTTKKLESFETNYLKKEHHKINNYLTSYLKNGGFPETHDKEEELNKIILIEIYNDIVSKDIVKRHNAEPEKLNKLIYYLISNLGKEYSYRSLSRATGINIETAERYLEIAKEAFLVFSIVAFSFKLKTQFKQNKKIYCIDTGLANAVAFKFSEDIGRIYENAVFLELKRRDKEIYYWKNTLGNEVDFIIKEGLQVTEAIQVCYNLKEGKTKEREIKSLITACKEFKLKTAKIITHDFEDEEHKEGVKISYVPLWQWLLEI